MTKFKINNVFEITNRGYFLSGEIVEGEIADGKSIDIGLKDNAKIEGIESVNFGNRLSEVGLRIGYIEGITKDQLNRLIGKIKSIR